MITNETPFLFAGNGQYANRGCEAIAKSSIRLIREYFPGVPIINGNELGDYDQQDESEPNVSHQQCKCLGATKRIVLGSSIYHYTHIRVDLSKSGQMVRSLAPKSRAVLSMGGDLYGLSHGSRVLLQYINLGEAALKAKSPFVIWCATIGKIESDKHLKRLAMDHFKRCSLILVRDQASFDYLGENGVRDNVKLVADPAFLLEPVKPCFDLPCQDYLAETIGVNLASSYAKRCGCGSYREMIEVGADCVERIMKTTGARILLIPHIVAHPEDTPYNDTIFLSLVRECLLERGYDIPLLPSLLRCWEIKWVLGKLRAYVGSRFHSTVGALGSCTPTISISFSEKAPALSKMLLGHSKYVMDSKNLTPQALSEMLSEMLSEEASIRQTLQQRIPEIKALAHTAGEHLHKLLVG